MFETETPSQGKFHVPTPVAKAALFALAAGIFIGAYIQKTIWAVFDVTCGDTDGDMHD